MCKTDSEQAFNPQPAIKN